MKIWIIIYALMIPITCYGGYRALDPARTVHTNSDWIFVSVGFILGVLFPLGAVVYAMKRNALLIKPSWSRYPLGWWTDPLQPLRLAVIGTVLYAFGGVFALSETNEKGVMLFYFEVALALGLVIGERLVYVIFKNKIAESNASAT